MANKYKEWIEKNVIDPLGECQKYSELMSANFPELKLVRGYYICIIWGSREHWWLQDENGNVIDPTASQFPSKGLGEYIEWDESRKEPTGMCPNCGGYAYDDNTCCSERCHSQYASYIMQCG